MIKFVVGGNIYGWAEALLLGPRSNGGGGGLNRLCCQDCPHSFHKYPIIFPQIEVERFRSLKGWWEWGGDEWLSFLKFRGGKE